MNTEENKVNKINVPVNDSRRSFAKAGIVAPILMTLVNKPALGGTCFSPSMSVSVNHSFKPGETVPECNGISPGNYAAQTDPYNGKKENPAYYWPIPPETPFHSFFSGTKFGSMTMHDVLVLNDGKKNPTGTPTDPDNVAKHLIGAYLNILNGFVPQSVLSTDIVGKMWTEYSENGFYKVNETTSWNGAQIVDYLKNNSIAP